jgi:predicted transcriptional regulator
MNTINLVLTRCLVLALILLYANLKAATYQNFQGLIDNKSLILSVDEGRLDEYDITVEGILAK